MELPLYQIDAFTGPGLTGNPAAVVILEQWPEDALLQFIAEQNNLSETAFVCAEGGDLRLRWFTPTTEVRLCGHATLATAFALWEHRGRSEPELDFLTASGQLVARRGAMGRIAIQLPEALTTPVPPALTAQVWQALGVEGKEVLEARFLMAVLEREEQVRALAPDMAAVAALPGQGLIATAPGQEVDFVSRFFAPSIGIPEDPVTGAAHCALAPYWTEHLGRPSLHARQLSRRGGELFCSVESGRVVLGGCARTYLVGTIYV